MLGAVKPSCGSGELLGPWKDGDGTTSGAFPYPSFEVLRQTGAFSNVFG